MMSRLRLLLVPLLFMPCLAQAGTGFEGVLTLERQEAGAPHKIVTLDLASLEMTAAIDGEFAHRPAGLDETVFIQRCGPTRAQVRVAVAAADGRIAPVTDCRGSYTVLGQGSDQRHPVLSYDGESIAVVDGNLKGVRLNFQSPAVAVYRRDGTRIALFEDMISPAWTRDGRLLMAGIDSERVPNGLYIADASLKSVEPLNLEGLHGRITGIATNRVDDRVAFIFNDQLWGLDLSTGEAGRLTTFSDPALEPAFSPDGRNIAFLSAVPGLSRQRAIYGLQVFDGSTVHKIPITFSAGGTLSWTAD